MGSRRKRIGCHARLLRSARELRLVKTQAQQTVLSLHRARAGLVKSRTALANQIRGLLGEFGIVLPQGIRLLGQRAMAALSIRDGEHCESFRALIQMLVEHLRELGSKVAELEGRIRAIHRTDAPGQLLDAMPGIGPLTASALAAWRCVAWMVCH